MTHHAQVPTADAPGAIPNMGIRRVSMRASISFRFRILKIIKGGNPKKHGRRHRGMAGTYPPGSKFRGISPAEIAIPKENFLYLIVKIF